MWFCALAFAVACLALIAAGFTLSVMSSVGRALETGRAPDAPRPLVPQ